MTSVATVHEDSTIPPRKTMDSLPSQGASAGLTASPITQSSDFGDYELLKEIARGGMGVVFLARQKLLNRLVALKMILGGGFATEEEIRRFLAEAESAASLNHPGIVRIFEVGCEHDQHFFSMEFIEGKSLAERLAAGPFVPKEAAEIIAATCDAIEFAHSNGIVHRDLKPANVIVDEMGAPHITDFGLARRDNVSLDTEVGELLGTVSYMPPEQAAGNLDQIGPRSDIYSLGATLYSLLAGHPPFHSPVVADTIMQVINLEPVPLRKLNDCTPQDLETICAKCLEKSPARRYGAAAELGNDLRRFLRNEPILARPAGSWTRLLKWTQRNPRVALLAFTLIAAIVALFAATLMYNTQLSEQRRQAQAAERQALELMELSSSLLSRLEHRRSANSSLQLGRASSFGQLCSTAFQLAQADDRESVRELLGQFTAEVDFFREQLNEPLNSIVVAIEVAANGWNSGPPPEELCNKVASLTAACQTFWSESATVEGTADVVRGLVAARVAQSAQLIITCSDRAACQSAIDRFSILATGTTSVVGLTDLQTTCLNVTAELNRWENGPPPPAVLESAKRARDLALVESNR
ncbi:MAG: serine/threonine-protein kinase [Planctomycetota bacterium]|nr:serine/threonine-protein kinase [Planctomycetota bacterium]